MPDIDIDICQDGRQKVIEYVRKNTGMSRRSSPSERLRLKLRVKMLAA